MSIPLKDVQKRLKEEGVDGWLLYDFRKTNDLAYEFLKIPKDLMVTRRFFYWIPAEGEPVKIVHAIESEALDHLPGKKAVYLSWQTLHAHLGGILEGRGRVAMEYSPENRIPIVSKVDAGVVDLVRKFGPEVTSSASFLQYYTCVWDDKKLTSHLFAAKVLDQTAKKTWEWIAECLKGGKRIDEYDIQQFILTAIHQSGCEMEGMPICGVNANTANPHYIPEKGSALEVKQGDFILIDLWCKKREENSVYADITRVAVAAASPSPKQGEIFQIVRRAQKAATEFVQKKWEKGEKIQGCEVDRVCRSVIEGAGYGKFFTHRTGHNIDKQDHGSGANIDSLETEDDRYLIPRTCFSIEPGIYLPGKFGIRLEYDVFLQEDGKIQITGGAKEKILALL